MIQKIHFRIEGTHCQSCKTLLESELNILPGIDKVEINYINGQTYLEYDDQKISEKQIFSKIEKLNYKPRNNKEDSKTNAKSLNSFISGFLISFGLIFVIGMYLIFKQFGGFEVLSRLNQSNIGYGLIFIIGILSGFHCIGMCGSIVVSYSTLCLGDNKKSLWPHWQYNIGRIASYTLIGAILGGFGAFFGINPIFNGIITVLAGILMLFLGLSLVFKWSILEKLKLHTPQFIAKYIFSQKNSKTAPLIIGLLNGFMPCGPLQAMQLYALTSGNALKGALSLFIFALGTSILMFSFGIFLSFISQKQIKNILKFSGALVIVLSLLMINRGLANFGINLRLPTIESTIPANQTLDDSQAQEVKMAVTYYGYNPNILYVKKDIPIRWIIDVKQLSGCDNQILMPDYNITKNLQLGQNVIEFTPTQTGEIKFSCSMRMIWGKFIVN